MKKQDIFGAWDFYIIIVYFCCHWDMKMSNIFLQVFLLLDDISSSVEGKDPFDKSNFRYRRPESSLVHVNKEVVMDGIPVVELKSFVFPSTCKDSISCLVNVTGLSSSWTSNENMILNSITFNLDHVSILVTSIWIFSEILILTKLHNALTVWERN